MERPYRGFSIIAVDGTETSLNGEVFALVDPKGLGVTLNNELNILNSVTYLTNSEYNSDDISFTVLISDVERPVYQNFLYLTKQFATGRFTLKYEVPQVGTYYRDVVLKSITKTEITKDHVMQETVTLQPLTFWYQTYETSGTFNNQADLDISLNFDTFEILPLYYRNEIQLYELSTPLNAPYWYCTHDDSHPGQDGYGITVPISATIISGNLNNSTYANIYNASTGETIDILSRQMPGCMTPLCLKAGNNTVTFKTNTDNCTFKYRITVKVESPII